MIRFGGMRKTLEGMRFDWKKLIRKEHNTTFYWVGGALMLIVWEHAANFGIEASEQAATRCGITWLLVVLAYATARVLKKRKRLGNGWPAPPGASPALLTSACQLFPA